MAIKSGKAAGWKANVYIGICIDLGSNLGFCAEVAAMAETLKHRETEIESVAAVSGGRILPPCGRCREMTAQLDPRNLECRAIPGEEEDVPLREFLPRHWLSS